jgi:hypothetical protein
VQMPPEALLDWDAQREYYDRLVRSEEEFYRIVNYILENPEKAGLRDWRWVGTSLKA